MKPSSSQGITEIGMKVGHENVGESMATIYQTGMGDAGRNKVRQSVRASYDHPLVIAKGNPLV
jgi:hypothetical protein